MERKARVDTLKCKECIFKPNRTSVWICRNEDGSYQLRPHCSSPHAVFKKKEAK